MSDRMTPMPFGKLMDWVLSEKAVQGQVFGVKKPFVKDKADKKLHLFNEKLETPFGPAAGPHTQLSQNIIAAYYGGSRFFELKTVQTLDGEDLPVAKPCIDAADECYNCEWSTELRVPQAFEEYVRGWFALKLLAREYELGDPEGFMFNMSVGYDLAGIQSEKIDSFIEGLKDASATPVWQECRRWTLEHLDRFRHIDKAYVEAISPKVCSSITLSTLHGCPPQEIERIAAYLIEEKGLNTFVKCNPTMLGYETARGILDSLGFGYVEFDDHHFKGDLQFGDAVPMFKRLWTRAEAKGLSFGLKLTNTCPVDNKGDALPGDEMYMSGRALYPLTVTLARKLAVEFEGKLRISYSGGADYFNIEELFRAGIWPITIATTLLKPGGYQRSLQIAESLEACPYQEFEAIDVAALERITEELTAVARNHKAIKPLPSRKLPRKVPLFDCFTAPCQGGCPIGQDVSSYVALAGEGRYLEALEVITDKNPLPFITGTICSHFCMEKCTRNFYEESIQIRSTKLKAAEEGYEELLAKIKKDRAADSAASAGSAGSAAPTNPTASAKAAGEVAVVGGGPAGLAAAYFLARQGAKVTVFEKADQAGGIVSQVIPDFRIGARAIANDVELVKAMGVEIRTGITVTSLKELQDQGFGQVVVAVGAWQPGRLELEQGESLNVLEFLKELKKDPSKPALGKNVAVIGGGNTAMDAARAAKGLPGVEKVSLVYRRTRRYMPADEEELALALEDGVEFQELLAPVSQAGGKLKCRRMVLGQADSKGRRQPVATEEFVEIPCDTVISAVGEKIDGSFYQANGLAVDEAGRPLVKGESRESANLSGVYVIGDGLKGPATVVEAIADAAAAAQAIGEALALGRRPEAAGYHHSREEVTAKRGYLKMAQAAEAEGQRCLECGIVCENCAQVCPNRANIAVPAPGYGQSQIVHVDNMCNECGNCTTFCPYDSSPYKEKLTLFNSEEDFTDSENQGFLLLDRAAGRFRIRREGKVYEGKLRGSQGADLPEQWQPLLSLLLEDYSYLFGA
ncbi:MAG: putative selenate reductase subunit YgfK [Clostridiales bacterium]